MLYWAVGYLPSIVGVHSLPMGYTKIDTLRISPRFTSDDWRALDKENFDDWRRAAEILKDRLDGRFLHYAGNCLRSPNSGFVVLAIHSLLLETIQQFREGIIDGKGQSGRLVRSFLKGKRFQPDFDRKARDAYYTDIRCGLLHQAEAKNRWLIRRDQRHLLREFPHGDGYIIDVRRFHGRVRKSFNDYLAEMQISDSVTVRENLWKKMNSICDVRDSRGVIDADIESECLGE